MKNIKYILILLIILVAIIFGLRRVSYAPTQQLPTNVKLDTNVPVTSVVAKNLEIPWSLVFISNAHLLFTERGGKIKVVNVTTDDEPIEVSGVPAVKVYGESGLLGAELHPNFETNKSIYLYYTYSSTGDNTLNRVSRFKLENNNLSAETTVVDAIPGSIFHNGGRIKFGPDGFLYITAGDARIPSLAQDKNSLAGKILRVTDTGEPAPGNPFDNRTYSYGHRNPQGLAWDKDGDLWETEHGNDAHDEVNLIIKGKNYGWPIITGNQEADNMQTPVIQSGSGTWAPSGLAYINESLYYAGLRGTALFKADPLNAQMKIELLFKNEFGRIRDVVLGPDGFMYISTNNKDGRGIPKKEDDKIIRINLNKL